MPRSDLEEIGQPRKHPCLRETAVSLSFSHIFPHLEMLDWSSLVPTLFGQYPSLSGTTLATLDPLEMH